MAHATDTTPPTEPPLDPASGLSAEPTAEPSAEPAAETSAEPPGEPSAKPPTEPPEHEELELTEAKATRRLRSGLLTLVLLVVLVVGLLLAVPGLHGVERQVAHMPAGFIVIAVVLEVLSCVSYVIAFLQVFDRAPIRFGARVALSELAFGSAVSLGGAGSVAIGAFLLVDRGGPPGRVAQRSAVLFLITSAANVIVLAAAGLLTWVGVLPGTHNWLLSLVPGLVGVATFVGFLALPWMVRRWVAPGRTGKVAIALRTTARTVQLTKRLLFSWDWRLVGIYGYLLFDIAVLGLCFRATGHVPPVSTIILAYQIGYLSAVIPVPGGIGVLDGSFVGMFILYGVGAGPAAAATLVYHAIALWVPAMWGTLAFLLLRRERGKPLVLRPPRAERRRKERAS